MDLDTVIARLLADEAVVYPTSTLPGLGARPTPRGLDAVFALKARGDEKPVSLAVRSLEQAEALVHLPELAHALVESFLRGCRSSFPHERNTPVWEATPSRFVTWFTPSPSRWMRWVRRSGANPSGEAPAMAPKNAERLGLPSDAAAPVFAQVGLEALLEARARLSR